MRVEKISPIPERGKGWARVFFKECEDSHDLVSMAILRPSHVAPYLGRMGWQVSESRFPVSIEVTAGSEFVLLIPPEVVQHLEVGNYEFLFFNKSAHRMCSVIVRWAGVTYRAPRGEISPINIVEQDPILSDEPIFGRSTQEETDIKSIKEENSSESSASINSPYLNLSLQGIAYGDPTAQYLPPTESTDLGLLQKDLYESKQVKRIQCVNKDCQAEILDSMKKCPFCGSSSPLR